MTDMTIRTIFTACAAVVFAAALLTTPLAGTALAETARDNYRFFCAQCHGLEGKGDGPNATRHMPVDPRDHTSAYDMSKMTDQDIVDAITGGGTATAKSSLMPPFGDTLTEEEIRALKDYIRGLCDCAYVGP